MAVGAAPGRGVPAGLRARLASGYGTAQGRYSGKEAAGGRDGNHLTDCLLTGTPICTARSARPSCGGRTCGGPSRGDQECPPFAPPSLSAGPLTVDAVARLGARPRGARPVLARLLSVLEDPGGRRVCDRGRRAGRGDDLDRRGHLAAADTARARGVVQGVQLDPGARRAADRGRARVTVPADRAGPGRAGARAGRQNVCAATRRRSASGPRTSPRHLPPAEERSVRCRRRRRTRRRARGDGRRGLGGRDAMLTAWALTRPDQPVRSRPRCSAGCPAPSRTSSPSTARRWPHDPGRPRRPRSGCAGSMARPRVSGWT